MDAAAKYRQELLALVAGVMPGRENALVFGEGPMHPRLMLVGEAPGEQESLMGRPFVGKAGQNLNHFLEIADLVRENIYITNAVKLRPTKTGKTGRVSNRPPTSDEIELFRPWLLREITEVNPDLVATLGNVPLRAVLGKPQSIGNVHGQVLQSDDIHCPIFALYHPASLIYNRALIPLYEQDVHMLAKKVAALSNGKTDI